MFNDRDLSILGAGAVAAILCLMLPWTFAVKVTVAVVILVIAMALAFARMGADRLTLEQYLKRQLVFRFQPRKYSYFPKEKAAAIAAVNIDSSDIEMNDADLAEIEAAAQKAQQAIIDRKKKEKEKQ